LRDADAALRQCGKQLEDQGRRLEEAQRGRREAEATVQHLQPLLQQREGEIQVCGWVCVWKEEGGERRGKEGRRGVGEGGERRGKVVNLVLFFLQDLRRQLHDADTQARGNGQAKDREIQVS